MASSRTWHAGERAVQERAGLAERADRLLGMQQPELPPVAREFLAAQPWIVLGAADADGRMWASPRYGAPGFITTPDATTVHVAAHPLAGDPLTTITGDVGGIALEPGTRRRMRLNGYAEQTADSVTITLDEVYSNCPKYIATREPIPVAQRTPERHAGSQLDAEAARLLADADTAFVATRAPGHGADVSHRGGNPGFLHVVDEHTVVWPDYQGNAIFNTLGNLEVNPSCGLTVVDPDSGTTLYLSGRARVLWEPRRVELRVETVVRLDHAAPLRWRLERPARNPPVA